MKNKQINKTLKGKTGKDLLSLVDEKVKLTKSRNLNAPEGEIEIELFGFWENLLGHNDFSINDDFFQTGGNSIKAIQLLSRISSLFSVHLEVSDIFLKPTIAELAILIKDKQKNNTGDHAIPLVEKQERGSLIPLSFSQERLLFIDYLEGSQQYHQPAVFRLKGDLNKDALIFSFKEIIKRHEVLRTVFLSDDGVNYQYIKDKDIWNLSISDGSAFKNDTDKLYQYVHELIKLPFDLSKDDMIRAELITLGKDENLLVVTMHHIASDGWSVSVLINEFLELYSSYVEKRQFQLPALSVQYADFAIWQRKYLKGESFDKKIAFWKDNLSGLLPLQMPTDYSRRTVQSIEGAVTEFNLDKKVIEKLKLLSLQNGSTLFMTLLSAFNILLYKYSGHSDICVGTPVAGRHQQELEKLIGFFVNTIAIRNEVNGKETFSDLLKKVKDNTIKAFENQEVPFEKVVDAVLTERDNSRNPLVQVMFVLQNTPETGKFQMPGVEISIEPKVTDTSKFELTFTFEETSAGMKGEIEYSTDLYSSETILRMIGHFKELLNAIIRSPGKSIDSLSMMKVAEKNRLLSEFNDTSAEYPKNKTIVDLFAEQVSKTPDNVALVFEDQQLTYKELNERSNQLAHYLKSKGVKTETLVPICIDRSFEMIIGILGIIKAGGAYVPIDPEYPEDRISYTIKDTGAGIVLSSKEVSPKISAENIEIIEIDGDRKEISKQPKVDLKTRVKPGNLLYIIYTSGSTGKPKGVMIEHYNVVRLFKTNSPLFDFSEKDVWTMFHSFCFDFSVWEMYGALLYGGKLIIVPKHMTKDASLFSELLISENVTILNQTPSSFYVLQEILTDNVKHVPVRYVIFGGEALNPAKLRPWKQSYPDSRLINMYGITETTVHVTYQEIEWQQIHSGNSIIGKPIPTLTVYILDPDKNVVPVGIAGEIYVGGAGLARGYLNLKELTKEKFIKDSITKEPGERLYRTGDLGRWLNDGTIEYLGRIDDQVKIRGYRIELGEIESVLQEHSSIRQSVVLARDTPEGSKRLVGYVVPEGDFNKEAVFFYLSSQLPEYMVPALWVVLESLPLTQNGKVDRKALPDPVAEELISNEYIEPRNELETTLSEIWKNILHLDRVGIHDNFFELGGDSIITIQAVSKARKKGIELRPRDIFIHQTIYKLSAAIFERSAMEVSGEQGHLTGVCGLLPIQQWYFENTDTDVSYFNQSVILTIEKSVTEKELSQAVVQLTSNHDALRFRYSQKDGQWIQEYGTKIGDLNTVNLRSEEGPLENLIKEHSEKFQRSLDIEKGELTKFVLFQTPEHQTYNRFLIILHHLATDGVSWRIIVDDLELMLGEIQQKGKSDPGSKSSSFRQWYEALEQYRSSSRLLSQRSYWEETAGSYEPLRVDKKYKEAVRVKDIESQTMRLDAVQTKLLLQEVPRAYHTEINDILLCALVLTISEWESKDKLVVGLEGHGRESISESIDTSRTVGWFTSLYPVLLQLKSERSLADSIKAVKEQLRRVPDKGLGYGVLKYINRDEKLKGKDCWDIVFNYLGQIDNVSSGHKLLSIAGNSMSADSGEEHPVSYLLSLNGMIEGGELILNWGYSSHHFENDTIVRLAEKYKSTLESLISHCIEQQRSGVIYTPSDYGLQSEISYEELDRFMQEPYNGKVRGESVEGLYRLSGLQQGMLFHALYDSRAGAYTEQMSSDLTEPDLNIISKSWNHILSRHSILRSGFYSNEFSIPVQCVYREVDLPLTILDYRDMSAEEQRVSLNKFKEEDFYGGFDFKTAPLMRVTLIRTSEASYRMFWTAHHMIYDGWSLPILIEEFLNTYETLSEGKELPAAEEDKYEDYIRYLERTDKDQEEKYWRNYIQGIEQSTLLPFTGTTIQRTKGAGVYESVFLKMDSETTSKAGAYAHKNHLTINTLIQGVWSYLLHRYTGSNDISYGVVVSGRPDDLPGIEQRVGMYINTLPLHSTLRMDESITEWLQELQKDQVSSRHYQYTPLQDIQTWTGVSGDLFDSIVVFENYPFSKIIRSKDWNLKVDNIQMREQTNYPLTLLVGSSDEIDINFNYNSGLIKTEYVKEICRHFENIFRQIIENGEKSLDSLELIDSSEKHQLLELFNDTEADYPKEKSITDLFEEQAAMTPDSLALVFGEERLTYKELNERSNRLAHYLKSKGVKAETLVPVCIDRSIDMIAGVLAILKAGGAYVPVDPEYPAERIAYMLEDIGAKVMVSSKDVNSKLQFKDIEVVETDGEWTKNNDDPVSNLSERVKPDNLAYVLYTSGSTGKPKGVRMPGSCLVNLLMWQDKQFSNKSRKVLQFTSLNFDVSFQEIFSTLCFGCTLYLINADRRIDMSEMLKDIKEFGITHLFVPYIVLKNLAEHISSQGGDSYALEEIITAGEQLKLTSDIESLLRKSNLTLINQYGPTEAHVVSSYRIDINRELTTLPPIGKPIDNTQLYIAGENNKLAPVGVPGELYIGGVQVARGYLNLPELTKEKFIRNPFSGDEGSRVYRTGDICRWLPDGNIEYIGRGDDQIKIRGYRVELGEIESVLQKNESVKQAVVIAKEDKAGNKRLIGYVVPEKEFERDSIVTYLRNELPEYMVPNLWVQLDSLPLTTNGKIDKRSLPDPDSSDGMSGQYVAPGNITEEKLAAIWEELLGSERVGVYDNFFELGGHSLLAMRLISAIRREMKLELAIKDLFLRPTIAELALHLDEQNKGILLPAIEVQPRPEHIPLSFSQERLWFIDQLNGSLQYHLPAVLRLKGKLNKDALIYSLQTIVNRHEVLRTVILEEEGNGYQYINPKDSFELQLVDGNKFKDNAGELKNYIRELISTPFDLSKDSMLRCHLINLDEEDNVLVVTLHHISSDGWSTSVIVRELVELYGSYEEGRESNLLPLNVQYADYAIWQRKYLSGEVLDSKLDYWKEKLKGVEPLQLPTDHSRPEIQSIRGNSVKFNIDKDLSKKILSLSQQNGATLFMTLLSAFKVLLYRYSGQEDICVGSPIAGRQHKETEDLVGFFINTLALRSDVEGKDPFTELLQKVKVSTLEAYEHQDVPFEKVVEATVSQRNMSRSPLFQVMFSLQNTPEVPEVRLGDVILSTEDHKLTTSQFDLILNIIETDEGLQGILEYCTDLYNEQTIKKMTGHFMKLLNSITEDPKQKVGLLKMLTEPELRQLQVEFNDTAEDYPKDRNVLDLFEIQVTKTPDKIALVFENQKLTYKELNEQSNQLAHYLQGKGIKEESLVPICIERSLDMLVAILGVLKSGGTFIPVDPEYPQDRIRYMLEDSQARTVIIDKESRSKLAGSEDIEIIELDADRSVIQKQSSKNLIRKSDHTKLAYVIFTSGSTGRPKGVMIEHGSLTNLLLSMTDKIKFNSESVFLSVTTFSFDICYLELFVPLINGGKLVLASREVVMDGYRLAKCIALNRPTHMQGTPSTWQVLIDSGWQNGEALKILVGGEALKDNLKDQLTAIGLAVNVYGPTETTIWSTIKKLDAKEKVTIGTPLANTNIEILSKDNQLVPVGVSGEILIGGQGLARGYLNRPELTSEKFIKDPFSNDAEARIYRTGDLGRWLPDGSIECLGRIDEQIKIRGYRIELGELESVLQQSGLVRQSVFVAKEDSAGNKRLVGYVIPEGEYDKEKISSYLRSKLPEYMVPSILVELDQFPLTPNGKINKKALPDPDGSEMISSEYTAPRNETEEKFALTFQDLLGIERVGIHDNFFELGGHSLLAMRAISSIRRELGLELAIKDLFRHPTIAELVLQLETQTGATLLPAIEIQPRPEHIPLSYSQERLWFIDRMEGSVQYHVPAVLQLKGKLNKEALVYALWNIVNRHEVLRSVIRNRDGVGYQYVKENNKWELQTEDGTKFGGDAGKLHEYIKQLINTPYDLSEDYMLRANLIRMGEEDHVLIVTLHHIASDGWSVSIIVRELVEFYNSFVEGREANLLPLPLQYADYSLWQRNYLKGEVLESKLSYWVNKLDGVLPLQLPADFKRPDILTFNGAFTHYKIDKDLTDKLNELSRQNSTTLFMILLAAFKVMLYRYSGQHDICVGSPIAGRQQQEVEGLIGFFVNSLALRSDVDSDLTFKEFLHQVRTTTLEAYENQEVPFETVVDAVVNEREVNRNPLFQVMFALQNTPEVSHLHLDGIQLTNYTHGLTTSKFDFTFYLAETAFGLDGLVEYSTDLYTEQTIERMIDHFKELLSSIVKNPEESIGSLSMLTHGEKHQLLAEFNDTYSEYPRERSIIELFDEQVLKTPGSVAVVYGQEKLTYKEFNERSNQLANYLIERGVRPGESIGLFCSRSNEMIIGMFGILKAGCSYVPFNTDYPAERLNFIIDDTAIKNIVTVGKELYNESGLTGYEVIDVKDSVSSSMESPGIKTNSQSCAYVMFTSGTTGRPKGISVSHRNIIKLVYDTGEISVKPEDRVLQWSNYSFDGSTYDIYSSLLTGASLYMIKDNWAADVDELAAMIKEQEITVIFVTTALFNTFIDINPHSLKGLRKILFGGEMVSPSHVRKALAIMGEGKIVHVYGPTETTVYAIGYPLDAVREDDVIPIGKPLSNTNLFVLNNCSQLVPVGVSGELFIGGDGVSQGYVNNPVLTHEKYLSNPFAKNQDEKMYRTGDIVKWLPDGNIVYLGREDDQVKIRGYRIELGEIESLMNKLDEVSSSCVIIVQDQAATNKLVAYYIPTWEEVKLREVDLYQKHIDNWNELYEIEYSKADQTEDTDYEFNIIGWNDSFTGLQIPDENMRVWLDDIVDVILTDQPKRVLEIGCGTGLIYYKLIGHIQKYIGIDFSEVSVNQIKNQIAKAEKEYPPTDLKVGFAHEVELDKDETVDMIILNSIVQYFPGEKYLTDILAKSIPMLKGKGKIIIGDVRDNRLLKSFKGRLHLAKSKETLSVADFNWGVEQEVSREEELCFSPEYFYNLRYKYPEITHIEIQWKDGDYENELTLYRYTAVIYVGIEKELTEADWLTWDKETGSEKIIEQLNNGDQIIAIKDLPNPRLSKEILLEKGMKDKTVKTVRELSEYISKPNEESIDIYEIISIAKSKGYKCRFFLDDDPFKINLFMHLGSRDTFVKQDYNYDVEASAIYTSNVPLLRDIFVMLKKDIQELLKNQLPEYMIPSELIALQNFPLNSNGKIDRNFLKKSEEMFRSSSINYKPPVTETEHELTSIWQELLGVERIGIHDNFFELGGHSLLAMRVVSSIRKQMEIEIAIKDIFLCPTISELGLYLEAQSKGLILPAVTVQEKPERIPLSFSQERLWFIDQLEGSIQYHVPSIIEMMGKLNKAALENSLKSILERHEVLRSVILESDGTGYQVVKNIDEWKLNVIDGSKYKDNNEGLQNYIRDLINMPFDLSKDYMLRGNLIRLSEEEHVLVIVLHHIASDGWSTSIMVRELVELYRSNEENREANLEPLQIQYVDFAIWQRNNLQGELLEKRLEYWKEKLNGVEQLQLPTDYSRPVIQSVKGADKEFNIDLNLATQLKDLSQKNGSTLFMTMLAVFKILLYRYSGQQDICVGSPTAGRQQKEIEELIGFFVNTLALRSEVRSDETFTELLEQVRLTTLEAYQYQDAPFEKVVEAVVSNRDMSRSPLFQVMFALQNTPEVPELSLGELNLNIEEVKSGISKFDLTLYIVETPFGFKGTVEYCTDLYNEQTIERMIGHFKELLKSIVKDPQQKVGSIPMLTRSEEHQLFVEFNNTVVEYQKGKSIIDLFEEQVSKSPDNIALVFEDQKLTYRELNERANQLAHYLMSKGVTEETLVPICIERSIEMITGILGILKSGGAYVAMDPEYPEERINFMLEDTSAFVVVSSKASKSRLSAAGNIDIIEIDSDWSEISKQPKDKLKISFKPEQLAYIIYTSGSTGRPKGVMIDHKNVYTFLCWCREEFKSSNFEIGYASTSMCFDLSVYEMFYPLSIGKPVRILENGLQIDKYLPSESSVMINCVPGVIESLLKDGLDFSNASVINMAGEPISLYVQQNLDSDKIEVRNLYGPSEDTTYTTNYRLIKGKPLLIGKPIANTEIYILGKENEPVPINITGEICISGDGLARGYLKREELTAEKFVKNPFREGKRMYRTGDIGRWLPDGNIDYLGRMDNQVKVRGYRIELGEIENVLHESKLVHQAVVLVRLTKEGSKRIVGYVVPEGSFDKTEVVSYLKSKLPDYMIPSVWVEMENLPLTQNGKIDKKALPDPDITESPDYEYIAPRNATEEKIATIWENQLKIDRVGIFENFFELGGHSLLAMRVISSIRREFKSELSIRELFMHPTIAELSEHLESQSKGILLPSIAVHQRPDRIPLSFSQERLWFIDKLEGSVQYHLPAVLRLKGELNKEALIYALQSIVNRHEVLRTAIREEDGKGYQFVMDKDSWKLKVVDGTLYNNNGEELHNYVQVLIKAPFNLSEDHMIRGHLIRMSDDEHLLVITLHHIAADGWSISILVKEFVELYRSYEEGREAKLETLQIQYVDYAMWQREYLQGEILDQKLDYWKKKFQGVEPLQLPTDYSRPAVQSTKGAVAKFDFDRTLTDSVNALSQQHGSTLFMTLLSAFNVLLYRYSGQEDICVGSPIAGRLHEETENLIGFFINTLVFRNELSGEISFAELLDRVRTTTLEAFEHQDVPFEKIVEAVVKQRDMSRNPLFQVSFMLQNTPEVPELSLGKTNLSIEDFPSNISKVDIVFSITETREGLHIDVEYCTDLYNEKTIERMVKHYKELLGSIVKAPHETIGKLRMLTKSEEHQLLTEFNDTAADYPKDKSVVDVIQENAAKAPNSSALEFENEKLTYKELNERSNQFAHYLQSKGVKSGMLVPICIERSIEMVIGIFGILKAGAAYVPIDSEYPPERISYMLEDTGASIIVTSKEIRSKIPEPEKFDIIEIDTEKTSINKLSKIDLQNSVMPDHLAYVIYTSGSTGKPKGVMIEHGGVVNLALSMRDLLWLKPGMKSLQFASLGFDASCFDIFNTLLSGGCLVLCNKEDLLSADGFEKLVKNHGIELATLPTSFQQMIKDSLGTIKTIVSAGEALNIEIAEYMKSTGIRLINAYGPTETTVCASLSDDPVKENNIVTIGKPNPNQQIYIIDKELNLCPVGVPGELCVAGVQLARGYLNRADLTSEKFIVNPFNKELSERLYRTGDLARWLPDGNIEYMGRIDNQVKIRGYRIELGEIESVLQLSEMVIHAVVLAKGDGMKADGIQKHDAIGHKRLVGYIVPNGVFDKEAIVHYLKSKLPEYMVPAIWVELEDLPLTQSGKIDRKALPDPDVNELSASEYEAPRNEIEKILSDIWKDLLHVDRVGINDNFFDLGGDSIITIQVLSRARRLGYELKPSDIFIHQTIASLSAAIADRSARIITGEQGLLTGPADLLPIQQWFFESNASDISHFNQSVLLSINKSVTPEILNKAVEQLIAHHDALRFIYHKKDGEWKQEYGFEKGELIKLDLLTAEKNSLADLINEHSDKYQRSLNIEKGVITKFVLMQTPDYEMHNRILIVIHHLAIDGVSWRILIEDLELLLAGYEKGTEADLGNKTSSYRQWYAALEQYSQSNRLLSQIPYWSKTERSYEPIAVDKTTTEAVKEKDMESIIIKLDSEHTHLLIHEVPRVYHTEINDILLCALALTICGWSSGEKAVIGLEGHGREDIEDEIDTSRTVGWFTSLYPVLLEPGSEKDLSAAIRSVKEQLRHVPDKGLGYGVLKYINKDEKLSSKVCWDIVFNYLGQIDNVVSSGNFLSGAEESNGKSTSEEKTINYLLAVNGFVNGGELILNWSYSGLHYRKETIEELAEKYKSTLITLISHCMDQQKSGSVYTPSDYGLESDISIDELDLILNKRI